uniref:Putative ovule protein n=1 Tax=Solanum chacoense TaxID=4108 RepID=A0A0V0GKN8_SOLCH
MIYCYTTKNSQTPYKSYYRNMLPKETNKMANLKEHIGDFKPMFIKITLLHLYYQYSILIHK